MSNGGAAFWVKQFINETGTPYPGVKVYHYSAGGGSTNKTVWADEAKTTEASQPVTGDSRGCVWFYGDGDYRLKITDSSDNVLYDWDNIRITEDIGTLWEGNSGTAYPNAGAANRWQTFVKHTAGNILQEVGINNGTSFVPIISTDKDIRYAIDTGAANAYIVTLSPASTAYTAGMVVIMKAINTNIGTSTINVNALGVKNITKDGATALTAGDILANEIVFLIYDGTQFQLQTALRGDGTINTNLNADMVDGLHFNNINAGASRISTASINNSTWTKVIFSTEDFDTGADYDNTTGCFTIPETGYYLITTRGAFAANATGIRGIRIATGTVCGTATGVEASSYIINAGATYSTYIQVTAITYLTVNTICWVEVYQDSGGALNFATVNAYENSLEITQLQKV